MTWHVPNAEEIDFALQLFRELVEPAMTRLDLLLETGRSMQLFFLSYYEKEYQASRDAIWRNDFCRCVYRN